MASAVYKSADGTEFDTELEADRHSIWVEKCQVMEDAIEEAMHAYVGTLKMANGKLFNIRGHKDTFFGNEYFYIDTYLDMAPQLRQITIGWNQLGFSNESDEITVSVRNDRIKDYQHVPISRLYTTKQEAMVAHVEESEKWLAEKQKHLAEYKASLSPQG